MYEMFEHTADIGLRIYAASLDELFAEAGRALFSVIVTNPAAVRCVQEATLEVEPAEPDDLLHDWLARLLFLFDTQRFIPAEYELRVHSGGVAARLQGERLDLARHQIGMEVKAVTYHELRVEETPNGWMGEVILDL